MVTPPDHNKLILKALTHIWIAIWAIRNFLRMHAWLFSVEVVTELCRVVCPEQSADAMASCLCSLPLWTSAGCTSTESIIMRRFWKMSQACRWSRSISTSCCPTPPEDILAFITYLQKETSLCESECWFAFGDILVGGHFSAFSVHSSSPPGSPGWYDRDALSTSASTRLLSAASLMKYAIALV